MTICILIYAAELRKSDSNSGARMPAAEGLGSFLCECSTIPPFSFLFRSLVNTHFISACSQYRSGSGSHPGGLAWACEFIEIIFMIPNAKARESAWVFVKLAFGYSSIVMFYLC